MKPLQIHLEPIMFVGRGYSNPDGVVRELAYELVFSAFLLGDGRARVFATHGELNRATVMAIGAALRAIGVHTVLVRRHGVEDEWPIPPAPGISAPPTPAAPEPPL